MLDDIDENRCTLNIMNTHNPRMIELCRSVLTDFELQPELELTPAADEYSRPELVIGGDVVGRGLPSRKQLKAAMRQRLSDW